MSELKIPDSYWSFTAEQLAGALGSSPAGLSGAAAAERLAELGPNEVEGRRRATAAALFLRQFGSPLVIILLLATLISAATKDWLDALIILAIVAGSAVLSFVQEYSATNAVERLRAQVRVTSKVMRDGGSSVVPAGEIVPGDVVVLSAGSLIPADGVVIEARDFFVNQAVLTGETYPVEKRPGVAAPHAALAERANCVFMGTNVRTGIARALITQTGRRTAFGQIAGRLSVRPPETEFERGIRRLGYLLTQTMAVLVLGVFAFNVVAGRPTLDSLLFSVALAVGLTPELLPAIISVSLSKGSQAMAAQGVIVRRLSAIENFGSMDVLCTDKTGTLTEGAVKLDAALDALGRPSEHTLRYAYLNARFQTGLTNPLDEAILARTPLPLEGIEKVDEIPYDFVRKRMSVVVREEGQNRLITKGALENVLEVCTHIGDDPSSALDREGRAAALERLTAWSAQGFRVLGLASRQVPVREVYRREDEVDLGFAGFLLFFDPPKPGVRETIHDLMSLGVDLKIITGDNKLVAEHTAQAIGMEIRGVMTGIELDEMREEALWQRAEGVNLFAEVDPNQKERIIRALQKMGHVVGYLGDGINDAPSLHAADVGISVQTAVDVAKDAADLVLLRSGLEVLQQGIIQGRRTFANSLKYIFMATSANFGNMFSVAGASLFLSYLPFLPLQILLINFLTDLPEMAIAGDNVDREWIERPRGWDLRLIRRFMLVFGPLSSLFDFLTFGLLISVLHAGQAQFRTGWFLESVLSAGMIVFALRTRLPLLRSRPGQGLALITLTVGLVTLALPYSPLAPVLGFQPLPPLYLGAVAVILLSYLAAAEAAKRWFYRGRAVSGR